MNKIPFVFCLFFLSTVAFAQETYRCNVSGTMVFQDRPCPGSVRRSDAMPSKPAAAPIESTADQARAAQQAKLEQDKEYINQRVKARNDEREKDQATERMQACENQAAWITQKISQIAAGAPTGTPLNSASAQGMMLDQQNRQTQIAALQAQQSAKRAECDQMRMAYNQRWKH